jgi:lipopolysaccharide/colanic/teichoic acid biosynthesis glycosyltransferase
VDSPLYSDQVIDANHQNDSLKIDEALPNERMKESRVSKRLSDLTTKRVVIVILLLLLIMPLFSKSLYFDLP